jgi:hypothetical protein
MKTNNRSFKLLLSGLFVSSSLALPVAAQMKSAPEEPTEAPVVIPGELEELFKTCETDWSSYERDLRKARERWQKELDAMSDEAFKRLDPESDPKIVMIGFHWPLDLKGKDELWSTYRECSLKNWEVKKELGSAAAGKADRKRRMAKIADLEECALRNYTKEKLLTPLDRVIKCYRIQAEK